MNAASLTKLPSPAELEPLEAKGARPTVAAALLLASLLGVGAALRLIGW